jgi:hypothetical protein
MLSGPTNPTKAHMQLHNVDRETASYWINSAMGGV